MRLAVGLCRYWLQILLCARMGSDGPVISKPQGLKASSLTTSSGATPSSSAASGGHKDHLAAFSFSIYSTITFNLPSPHFPVFVDEQPSKPNPATPAFSTLQI